MLTRLATATQNGDDIALPHRRYVYEGDVLLVVGKQTKERSLFLFNDIIILAKLKKKKYDVDANMALKGVKVVDIEGTLLQTISFHFISSIQRYLNLFISAFPFRSVPFRSRASPVQNYRFRLDRIHLPL